MIARPRPHTYLHVQPHQTVCEQVDGRSRKAMLDRLGVVRKTIKEHLGEARANHLLPRSRDKVHTHPSHTAARLPPGRLSFAPPQPVPVVSPDAAIRTANAAITQKEQVRMLSSPQSNHSGSPLAKPLHFFRQPPTNPCSRSKVRQCTTVCINVATRAMGANRKYS